MIEKFDKNNELEFPNQEDNLASNYQANLDDDKQELYEIPRSHRHIKFWGFLILVFAVLLLSGTRFYNNFVDPLKYDTPDWLAEQLNPEEEAEKTLAELRENDTDQDGLTDYQEIYQYYTSMFLPDTDSDGFTDAEEVNLGEDPLCPINESCSLLRLITPSTKLSDIVQDVALDPDLTVQSAAVVEFRKFLEENGMPKEDLDLLDDQDLLAIFRIVAESEILDEGRFNASSTPEQIKEFLLLLPGIDSSEINSMTDEELILLGQELLEK
jgi:hypothetical protein